MVTNGKIRISEAAKILGVSVPTLRNWEKSGKLRAERSVGKQRYYNLTDLQKFVVDVEGLGLIWATSAIPQELPREYYCESSDRFTTRVTRMGAELQRDGRFSGALDSLITLVASEIGDNSFAHNLGNWQDVLGMFFAYDLEKKIIVIADRGQGVKTTLLRVRPSLASDMEALKVAFTEIISGRNPEKRGNGLKVVLRVLESREVGLFYRSGIGVVTVPVEKPGYLTIGTADQNVRGMYCVIKF